MFVKSEHEILKQLDNEHAKEAIKAQHRCLKYISAAINNLELGKRAFTHYEPQKLKEIYELSDVPEISSLKRFKEGEKLEKFLKFTSQHILLPLHNEQKDSFLQSLNKSAIVFAHSALDDTLNVYIKSLYLSNPKLMTKTSSKKEITFSASEFYSDDLENLINTKRQEKLNSLIKEIQAKSIPKKFEQLFKLVGADLPKEIKKDYTYNTTDIKEFDTLRHDIIHNDKSVPDTYNTTAILSYLYRTVLVLTPFFLTTFLPDLFQKQKEPNS